MRRAKRFPRAEARSCRVMLILTTDCHAKAHRSCRGSIASNGMLFRCVCDCHASDQMGLEFATSCTASASYSGNHHVQ
jgi:hypothetical protein